MALREKKIKMSKTDLPNPIDVVIYSYKNKMLKEVVENLLEKSSKKNAIYLHIFDQHTLTRQDYFDKIENCGYQHILWDSILGPCFYKNQLLEQSKFTYTMFMSDNIFLKDNWDEELINALPNSGSIISIKNKNKLKQDGIFYFKKEEEVVDKFTSSKFVGRDLIFGHTETLRNIGYPSYLKYYGEEEVLSLMYHANNIKVFCCPDNFYKKEGLNNLETLYTVFSKYHNYNQMIKLIKNEKNDYIDIGLPLMSPISDFYNINGLDIEKTHPLPFEINDVFYNPTDSEFDGIDSKRFMTKINYID